MTTVAPELAALFDKLADAARSAGVFGEVGVEDGRLVCQADGSAEPAAYRVELDGGKVWVSLVMADRWQSESIEAELVHTGDKLDELLEEEMVEQGYEGPRPTFEHFRSDDMLFTFRTPMPFAPELAGEPASIETARAMLLGYEACFRQLGDMDADNAED